MKPAIASADMEEIAQTKNPSSKYFNPRRGISSQRQIRRLPLNSFCPSSPRYSEMVPIGQTQLQNALRRRNDIVRKVINRNIAAGCIAGMWPVTRKYFRFISPAMGRQHSTPAGGSATVVAAPV